jgi:hypothetical protein
MPDDKREVPRIKKSLVVHYALDTGGKPPKWDVTHIMNIGEKGIRMTVLKDFAEGDILNLNIKIPFKPFEPLTVKGKIITTEELTTVFGEGVADCKIASVGFIDIDEEQKDLIKEYVEWFHKRYGGEA